MTPAPSASIDFPLAAANTSATPSLAICAARSVEEPKSNVTCVPGFAASNARAISSNGAVSDDAANTASVRCCIGAGREEHAATSTATATTEPNRLIGGPPP